jgi:hypothetical protein
VGGRLRLLPREGSAGAESAFLCTAFRCGGIAAEGYIALLVIYAAARISRCNTVERQPVWVCIYPRIEVAFDAHAHIGEAYTAKSGAGRVSHPTASTPKLHSAIYSLYI